MQQKAFPKSSRSTQPIKLTNEEDGHSSSTHFTQPIKLTKLFTVAEDRRASDLVVFNQNRVIWNVTYGRGFNAGETDDANNLFETFNGQEPNAEKEDQIKCKPEKKPEF